MLDWKLYAVGSALFAGLTAVLAKVGVRHISSNMATLVRTFVIIIFIGVVVGMRREWKSPFSLDKVSLTFLVLSAITTGLSWLCYFRALQGGPASLVAPIDKLSLVFAVVLSLMFLGERLGAYQWLGVCLITCGTLIIIFK